MTPQDHEAIASLVVAKIEAVRKDFWVEPEPHYKDHLDIRELVAEWRKVKGLFWHAFIGLAIIGAVVLAAIGLGLKVK